MTAPTAPDISDWAYSELGVYLEPAQTRVAESAEVHHRTAGLLEHADGASYLAAVLTAHWVCTHDPATSLAIVLAPTQAQVGTVWGHLARLHSDRDLPGRVLERHDWADTGGQLLAFGRSVRDPHRLAGIHQRDVLVVVDDADRVPHTVWPAVDAMTMSDTSRVVSLSTRWAGWNVIAS